METLYIIQKQKKTQKEYIFLFTIKIYFRRVVPIIIVNSNTMIFQLPHNNKERKSYPANICLFKLNNRSTTLNIFHKFYLVLIWGKHGYWNREIRIFLSSEAAVQRCCSKNMQQIYRGTPMLKCAFNKVPLQLYWNHT